MFSKPAIFNPFQSSSSLFSRFFFSVSCLIYTFLPSFESLFLCFTNFDGSSHGLNFYMKEDHRSCRRNFGVAKRKREKHSGLYGIRTLDPNDTDAALYTNWAKKPTRSRSLNCDSVTEIPHWWRKIYPESGQKRWLVDGVVTVYDW